MSTVYVTQSPMRRDPVTGMLRPVHDITPAAKYGAVNVLLPGGPVILSTEQAVRTIRDKLSAFTERDYLLCMGDPSVIAVTTSIASHKTGGKYRLLVWDRKTAQYLPVTVNLFGNSYATQD